MIFVAPKSNKSTMALLSALVVMEMVWAAEAPLETKTWEPMGPTG